MHTRKLQLIAGSTYTVSLPKDWVKKHGLKPNQGIYLHESADGNIIIAPGIGEIQSPKNLRLNVEEYESNIEQILFAAYSIGAQSIELYSPRVMSKQARSLARRAVSKMSATEISFEDEKTMKIEVLLDISKADMMQLLYRLSLIIESSLNSLLKSKSDEIEINEREVDRLYMLISKIITLSLTDSNILHSSNIASVSLIPSYFLISKKLENIHDSIYVLSSHHDAGQLIENSVASSISSELIKAINHIRRPSTIFAGLQTGKVTEMNKNLASIKDKTVQHNISNIFRYVIDIQEEAVNISFISKFSGRKQ